MSEPFILSDPELKTPYGRYHIEQRGLIRLRRDTETKIPFYGYSFCIESLENEHRDHFWVPIQDSDLNFICYLKFSRIDEKLFQLTEVRPADCPLQDTAAQCTRSLGPLRGGI